MKAKKFLVADVIAGIVAQAALDDDMTAADIVSDEDFVSELKDMRWGKMATKDTPRARRLIEAAGYRLTK